MQATENGKASRSTAIALALLCAALGGVMWGAVRLIRRDRVELVEHFGEERLRQVDEAAREIGEDLDDVAGTLRMAARLFESKEAAADPERELRALHAAVKQYRIVRVYDAAGRPGYSVGEPPDASDHEESAAIEAAFAESTRHVLRSSVHTVEAVPVSRASRSGWSRIFASTWSRSPDGHVDGAIAVLLDMHRLFDKLHLLGSDGASRVLLLGGPGEPTAASDPALAAAIERVDDKKENAPQFALLLQRMRDGGHATLSIDGAEAARLGLGAVETIATFTAIRGEGAGRWSIATLSSTAGLRAHEQAIVLRLGAAAGVVALLLLVFGGYVVVAARRAVLLRERLRSADALSHLHEKTEKILDNIPTGVMALSDDGRITAVNRALREKIAEGALGGDLAAAFPEAPAAVVARLSSLIAGARTSGRVRSLPGERLALFGEEGQYSLHAVPLEPRFPDTRVLLVVEDVSEVRSLAGQLLRAEKLATIGVLAAGIAHEIGTPLGVVRGRAEYILGKLGPGHTQAQGLQVIVDQIDRVSRTIRQLLDFARVKPASVRTVQVAPVARAVAELLRFEAERRKVEVTVEMPDDLPPVMADPDQLQQVFVNLAMNALDACEAGGHVKMVAGSDGGTPEGPGGWHRVRIEVIDDGCGIPEENRLQIFDPFFTTKKRGQGTGLGLTMAADIARNHGADIEVESEAGRGTRMIVLWPTEAKTEEARSAG